MLSAIFTKKFKKEYHLALKRGLKQEEIDEVLELIINQKKLLDRHRDHYLSGNYVGHKECHIKNDYLLIYKLEPGTVIFERLGTHSDLFK